MDGVRGPVRMRLIEHVPFPLWDAGEWLGDDYHELRAWLGLSRSTYDALAGWQRDYERAGEIWSEALLARGVELRELLADELGARYVVRLDP